MLIINCNNEALSYLSPVPSAYREVEYIQSNGNQYINTGISRSICQLPIIEYIFYTDTTTGDC